MTKITISVGLFLTLLGVITYFGTGMVSITALIPTFFGLPILILGWLHGRSTGNIALYIAIGLAVLGFFGAGSRFLGILNTGEFDLTAAPLSVLTMTLVLGGFIILAIKHLVDERRHGVTSV